MISSSMWRHGWTSPTSGSMGSSSRGGPRGPTTASASRASSSIRRFRGSSAQPSASSCRFRGCLGLSFCLHKRWPGCPPFFSCANLLARRRPIWASSSTHPIPMRCWSVMSAATSPSNLPAPFFHFSCWPHCASLVFLRKKGQDALQSLSSRSHSPPCGCATLLPASLPAIPWRYFSRGQHLPNTLGE
jgi:hypothetical protein